MYIRKFFQKCKSHKQGQSDKERDGGVQDADRLGAGVTQVSEKRANIES